MKKQYTYKEKVRIKKGFFKGYYAEIKKEIKPQQKYKIKIVDQTTILKGEDKEHVVTIDQIRPLNIIEKAWKKLISNE